MGSKELQQLQEEDESLAPIRKAARGEANSMAAHGFFRQDGLIYRRWTPPGRDAREMEMEQLVLPRKFRRAVLQVAHEIPMAGHMGRNKTTQRTLRRFYWPTIFRDVKEFCRTCPDCQKASSRKGPRAPLIPLPVIEEPFYRIAMDIVGPLPRSWSGNKYILVLCDYATRYPEALPLKTIDAEHIAEALINVFAGWGVPREILTDQGSNFTSQLLAELYRLLGVKALRISPYHPQTDGLVERFNQTLKAMLRKTVTEEGKNWDKLLPYVLFAYREVPQVSTGFSPFELLYGREVRGPLDVLRESWEANEKSNESVVSHILSIRERMARMMEMARENEARAKDQQKKWYDRNARSREFKEGDEVLVMLPTSTSKLLAQWQGLYTVTRKVGEVSYEVDMYDRRKRRRIFHINMLRGWNVPKATGYWSDEVTNDPSDDIPAWREEVPESEAESPTINEELSRAQRQELCEVLIDFADVLQNKPGKTTRIEHRIGVKLTQPMRLPPYRLPHAYRATVQKELMDMEREGIIDPSTSEWASPLVIVKKKDGMLRLCVDYRRLNSIAKADAYPMPRIDDLIDRLGGAKYITTLDLTRGYWQVPMAKESQPLTAFATPFGLYQFRVMPFGLSGAPATFQRLMDGVIRGLEDFSAAYLDDLIIYSTQWEEHLHQLRAVFGRLRDAGLTAKPRKCQFGMSHCVYLGHVVGGGVVRPEPPKLEAVRMFPISQTKKQVRTFLGLSGYYRKFIRNYAAVAVPLTDLTKKSAPIKVEWSAECEQAFETLKQRLCSAPVLRSPDFEKEFILQTDASERGIGAVLSQKDENGEDHPIAFFSRKLLEREEKYATVEKECLAIKLACQAFRVYLLGRPFLIETDHRALEWLDRLKENNARLSRWSLLLQIFDFQVKYPGVPLGAAVPN